MNNKEQKRELLNNPLVKELMIKFSNFKATKDERYDNKDFDDFSEKVLKEDEDSCDWEILSYVHEGNESRRSIKSVRYKDEVFTVGQDGIISFEIIPLPNEKRLRVWTKSSDFWIEHFKKTPNKEEPKKDYEILKMIGSANPPHEPVPLCKYNDCKIFKVKRLSDNTEWFVGQETDYGKILGFKIHDDRMTFSFSIQSDVKVPVLRYDYLDKLSLPEEQPLPLFKDERTKFVIGKSIELLGYIKITIATESHYLCGAITYPQVGDLISLRDKGVPIAKVIDKINEPTFSHSIVVKLLCEVNESNFDSGRHLYILKDKNSKNGSNKG